MTTRQVDVEDIAGLSDQWSWRVGAAVILGVTSWLGSALASARVPDWAAFTRHCGEGRDSSAGGEFLMAKRFYAVEAHLTARGSKRFEQSRNVA